MGLTQLLNILLRTPVSTPQGAGKPSSAEGCCNKRPRLDEGSVEIAGHAAASSDTEVFQLHSRLLSLPKELLHVIVGCLDAPSLAALALAHPVFAKREVGDTSKLPFVQSIAMQAVTRLAGSGASASPSRWRRLTWLQRLAVEQTGSAIDPARLQSAGVDLRLHPTMPKHTKSLHLSGMGPKLVVSKESTADTPLLRWRFRLRGNSAVEFGVVPLPLQGDDRALHKAGEEGTQRANCPIGFRSTITVGSTLPLSLPLDKGALVEVVACGSCLEVLITAPAPRPAGAPMPAVMSANVPPPYGVNMPLLPAPLPVQPAPPAPASGPSARGHLQRAQLAVRGAQQHQQQQQQPQLGQAKRGSLEAAPSKHGMTTRARSSTGHVAGRSGAGTRAAGAGAGTSSSAAPGTSGAGTSRLGHTANGAGTRGGPAPSGPCGRGRAGAGPSGLHASGGSVQGGHGRPPDPARGPPPRAADPRPRPGPLARAPAPLHAPPQHQPQHQPAPPLPPMHALGQPQQLPLPPLLEYLHPPHLPAPPAHQPQPAAAPPGQAHGPLPPHLPPPLLAGQGVLLSQAWHGAGAGARAQTGQGVPGRGTASAAPAVPLTQFGPSNEIRARLEYSYAGPVKLAMTLWHGSMWELLHEEMPGLTDPTPLPQRADTALPLLAAAAPAFGAAEVEGAAVVVAVAGPSSLPVLHAAALAQ